MWEAPLALASSRPSAQIQAREAPEASMRVSTVSTSRASYRLAPETVRLIEENLGIIDEAIRQSLTALEATPLSVPLQQAVMTSYERKLDFLRQAAAITAEG